MHLLVLSKLNCEYQGLLAARAHCSHKWLVSTWQHGLPDNGLTVVRQIGATDGP